jgi:hypothetical protein
MWASLVLVALSASPSSSQKPSSELLAPSEERAEGVYGSARACETENFCVQSFCGDCDARTVAERCESWRKHLQAKWLGTDSGDCWSPRCNVVVHARRETYRAAIGSGGDQSFGSSLIDAQGARISIRRVDLLVDPQGAISALGHELTHVVLADAFAGSAPPAWANEGAAVLADSAEKQQLHRRDFDQSFRRQTVFHCAELLNLSKYPSPYRIPAFYGQSASLIAFLNDIGSPKKLVPFIRDAGEQGYDAALREHYGIQGVAELQRRWLKSR